MKVGDLVTLSQYGMNLECTWMYRKDAREGKLVGLLTEVIEKEVYWTKGTYYVVQWVGPKYKKMRRTSWMKPGHFKRNDLKMYRTPKKK
tara:strand:- start:262 stop:528 length:267 start_codon:yes stop_codon:yes gene_type:complete